MQDAKTKNASREEIEQRHLPAGHPSLPPRRIGELLLNLGTPDATSY